MTDFSACNHKGKGNICFQRYSWCWKIIKNYALELLPLWSYSQMLPPEFPDIQNNISSYLFRIKFKFSYKKWSALNYLSFNISSFIFYDVLFLPNQTSRAEYGGQRNWATVREGHLIRRSTQVFFYLLRPFEQKNMND